MQIECKICGKIFSSYKELSIHIRLHKITSKDYYDKHLLKVEEGKCLYCGNKTRYYSITQGYAKYCSYKCINNSPEIKEKINQTNLKKYGKHHSKLEDIKNKVKVNYLFINS